jgi:TonB-dependent receptor
MLSSAELYKTPEARIDEGGIGGTVILRTRRPLDLPANTGYGTIEGTYSDTSETTDPQASGMYSWHSEDERFGVLIGATQQKRTNRSMEVDTESWAWRADDVSAQPATNVNGNTYTNDSINYWDDGGVDDQAGNHYSGFWIPQSVNFGVRNEERERKGVQLTLQFKPADQITMTANYFRFELDGDYTVNLNKIPEWGFGSDQGKLLAPNGLTFDPSGTIVTGTRFQVPTGLCSDSPEPCNMETPQLSGYYSREEALSQTADFEIAFTSESLDATFKGGRTWSEGGPSMMFRMSAKPRWFNPATGAYQNGNQVSEWDLGGTPSMTFSPDLQDQLMNGIAEIDIGSTDSSWIETEIEQTFVQADFTKYFDNARWLDSLQFGVKHRGASARRSTGNTYWLCPGFEEDYENRYQICDPQAGAAQPEFFLSQPIDNIPGGFSANLFPGIDFPGYVDYLNNRFGGSRRHEEENFVYNVDEDIWSGYIQANFRTERLRGNVGVRIAQTRQHIDTTDRVTRWLDAYPDDANGNPMRCPASGISNGINCTPGDFVYLPDDQSREEFFVLNVQDKTYTDVLPSFNFAYDLTEDLVLRGAASKVIARTGYGDLGQLGSLEFITQEYYDDRGQFGAEPPGWYGEGGNKELEPYEATQYDLGLEWYFHPGSVVGVGLFRKNVKNFILPVVRDQELTIDGETVMVNDFSTRANGQDGVSQGVELYAQHTFDFGLGLQANYTYNDTNLAAVVFNGEQIGESPLVGSAKNQANFTMFYENERFLARVSYNRRGEVVGGLFSGLSLYYEPFEQIDLNASYNFTDRLTLTGSVLNLTESEQRAHLGDDTEDRLYSNIYSGRQLYLGLTYKF